MLLIYHPPGYAEERKYIFDVVFREFLGLDYRAETQTEEGSGITISDADDAAGRQLCIADVLFRTDRERWLTEAALPGTPLPIWDIETGPVDFRLPVKSVPVIYGKPLGGASYIEAGADGRRLKLGIDLFGGMFFMLSRYEEVVKRCRDGRERFPASASLAGQEGFLMRPIVNEYLEVLWSCLHYLWPGLTRTQRQYRQVLSHDVDWAYGTYGKSFWQVCKGAAGDIVTRRSLPLAVRRFRSSRLTSKGMQDADLFNTFDFIMDNSERNGVTSSFYFIAARTAGNIDGNYSIEDPWILKLFRRIRERGHEIGLHTSYNSFRSADQIRKEHAALQAALERAHIYGVVSGGRQHYLRWEAPTTWQAWEDAGMRYDSTLGFAERIGFRCGTCYEYPAFNLFTGKALKLRERPLLAMDVTLLNSGYMNLSRDSALRHMQQMKRLCKRYNGSFTLLWHNSQLVRNSDVQLYRSITDERGLGAS